MIDMLAAMVFCVALNVLCHPAPRAFATRHGFRGLDFRDTGFALPKGTTSVAFGGGIVANMPIITLILR